MLNSAWQVTLSAAVLVFGLIVFDFTNIDLVVQHILFDSQTDTWIWHAEESISRNLLYDGVKRLLIVFALSVATVLALSSFSSHLRKYRRGLRIVLLSLVLVPALVSLGKAATNVPCPRDIVEFGGAATHTGIIKRMSSSSQPKRYRCFPAGHASGGFALFSLYFLFQSRARQSAAIALGLSVGWATGLYKMAIGDHFLSHTVVTMVFAWLVVNLIALADLRLFRADRDQTSGAGKELVSRND